MKSNIFKVFIPPMLAREGDTKVLKNNNLIFQRKLDGTRALFFIDRKNDYFRIQNRNFFDITKTYPEFKSDSINYDNCILDGEICYIDGDGKDDFNVIQHRTHLDNQFKISILAKKYPLTYVVFDILFCNGMDLRNKSLEVRQEYLRDLVNKKCDNIQVIENYKDGVKLFDDVVKNGGEGVVAKDINSVYVSKRSDTWVKVKKWATADDDIIGYEQGSIHGALILKNYGKVSLKSQSIRDFYVKHKPKKCEIRFQELSKNNKARFPVFVKFK